MEIGGLDDGVGVGVGCWLLISRFGVDSIAAIWINSIRYIWISSPILQNAHYHMLTSTAVEQKHTMAACQAEIKRGQWSMHYLLPLMLNTVSGRERFMPMPGVVFWHCLGVLRSNDPSIAAFIMKRPRGNEGSEIGN
eukprot:11554155-Ditylum_brightwellii.AAC.1